MNCNFAYVNFSLFIHLHPVPFCFLQCGSWGAFFTPSFSSAFTWIIPPLSSSSFHQQYHTTKYFTRFTDRYLYYPTPLGTWLITLFKQSIFTQNFHPFFSHHTKPPQTSKRNRRANMLPTAHVTYSYIIAVYNVLFIYSYSIQDTIRINNSLSISR